jgi:N-acetyl-gamma-glutamyl-phosphate reductase
MSTHVINIGIIGATGHTGEELIDILLRHPFVRISRLYNTSDHPVRIVDVFPRFRNRLDLECRKPDLEDIKKHCDIVFCALPHTVSLSLVGALLRMGKKVIDLSADFRLKNRRSYAAAYGVNHPDPLSLKSAVYGIPELRREDIRRARLIANPGCYPTSVILALAPLLALRPGSTRSIIIDAKSGVSGAGKKVSAGFLFEEVDGDFRAYKVDEHQHAPEMNQELSLIAGKKVEVTFVPHLLPLTRGILSTVYVEKSPSARSHAGRQGVRAVYEKFYAKEPFVRVLGQGIFPRLKDVRHTNFCDIGIKDSDRHIILISAIDNLMKGAAGQAVQNMNIMAGYPETTALI